VTSPLDSRLRATLSSVATCGALLTLSSWALFGPGALRSAAIGAALAWGNLWALARIVAALLGDSNESPAGAEPRAGPSARRWAVLAALKMLGLFAIVWLLMREAVVSPIAMLAGFASLPLGIAIGSMVSDRNISGEH
jgi:hypothetical protein